MQRNGGSWRLDMDNLPPPSADGGRSLLQESPVAPVQIDIPDFRLGT